MAGTKVGGEQARNTNRDRHGSNFYAMIGQAGGSIRHPETRMFYKDRDLARRAGKLGGQRSRRKKSNYHS